MPLRRGFAAAGQPILTKLKPAYLTHYGRYACLLSGLIVLVVSSGSLVGPVESALPKPPKKPDALTLVSVPPVSIVTAPAAPQDVGPYKSPEHGPQMDIYRDIFTRQAQGDMDGAQALAERLKDKTLLGHVLAQRFLHPSYKAQFGELKDWMDNYADLPQAARIERLARLRAPSGYKGDIRAASYQAGRIEELALPGVTAKTYHPKIKRSEAQEKDARALIGQIRRHIQIYEPSKALRTLQESGAAVYLDDVEKDRLRALIAAGYLYANNLEMAEKLSASALRNSRGRAPMAGWVLGLVKWREGSYGQAAAAFSFAAESDYSNGAMASGASFWTARAYKKTGNDRKANAYLARAAQYPRSFYGLLALQSMGEDPALNWKAPSLTRAAEKKILSTPAGARAEKLIAAGEITLAEDEIRALYISGDHERKKELLAYAQTRRLPSLSLKLGHALGAIDKDIYDAALYPAMPWQPEAGYRIDRALLHAIARQESRFDPQAQNKGSGATGLMQLMPRTASYMMEGGEDRSHLLKNAETSLDIGQKYVEYLLNSNQVGQDLLSLAIAYNAGPGTLRKWKSEREDVTDPLLFIETIPFAETRTYVQRVLANYWIYRMRFEQENDSMQALANGHWARYAALDKGAVKFAEAR